MNEIVTFGHPALITKSSNIVEIDDYIVNLSKKLIDIMYEAPGVGLAAPQIGINKNIFHWLNLEVKRAAFLRL